MVEAGLEGLFGLVRHVSPRLSAHTMSNSTTPGVPSRIGVENVAEWSSVCACVRVCECVCGLVGGILLVQWWKSSVG
jgi:hypothetical protein